MQSIYDLEEQRHSLAKAEEKAAKFIDEENRRHEKLRKEKERRRRERKEAIERKRATAKNRKLFRASLVIQAWIRTVTAESKASSIATIQASIRAHLQGSRAKAALAGRKATLAERQAKEECEQQEREREEKEKAEREKEKAERERQEREKLRRELEAIGRELQELERKRREEAAGRRRKELERKRAIDLKNQQEALRVRAAVTIQRRFREHRRRTKSAILWASMDQVGLLGGSKRASSTVVRTASTSRLTGLAPSTTAGTVADELYDIEERRQLKEVSFRFQGDHDDENDDDDSNCGRGRKEIVSPPRKEIEKGAACCGPGGSGCVIS